MPAEVTVTRLSASPTTRITCPTVQLLLLVMLCLCLLNNANAEPLKVAVSEHLHSALTALDGQHDESEVSAFHQFYAQRQFQPAWLDLKRLAELEQLTTLAEMHGLEPDDYQLHELGQRIRQMLYTDSPADLAALELAATKSVARLASHLSRGKVDQSGRYPELNETAVAAAPLTVKWLQGTANSETLFSYLHGLTPNTLLYRKMMSSLQQHREQVANGIRYPHIPEGRLLKAGVTDARVPLLRQRLGLASPVDAGAEWRYDSALAHAVTQFQQRHGINADGLFGRRTRAAMNVSLETRIDQLRVNLDIQRWARLPEARDYLLVNIAHYQIHMVSEGARTWSMRVQVGKRSRPTPTFKSELTSIVANPAWTVPPTIFREDILPKVQADPRYLQANNMYPVDRRGQRIDPTLINWSTVNADTFPYRLRSGPWAGNALGRMKFQMPNPYLIYLHDTPSKHLFSQDMRAYSSGCIRVEDPVKLARAVLAQQRNASPKRLQRALATDATRYIGLDRPLSIVVMYGTVDINAQGDLVFANDIYRHDAITLAALQSIMGTTANPSLFASR